MSRVRVPSPAPFLRVDLNRFKFISSTLIFIVAFLFAVKFTFYPASSYILRFFGISYDFSRVDMDLDGNISISGLSVVVDDLLEFRTEKFEVGFSRRTSGFLKKDIVIKKFKLHDSVLTFDSEWLTETTDISVPDELPFFPLEEIDIENLKVVAVIDEKNGAVADKISLKGNRTYDLIAENTVLFAEKLTEKLNIKLRTQIEAHEYVYLLSSLSLNTTGIDISGRKSDSMGNFEGRLSISLEKIAALFNEKAKGQLESDFSLNVSEKIPNIDVVLSTLGVEYEGFQPWDVHAFVNITPTIMHIDRLNLFHNKKVFLSLDGEFPYSEKKIKGVARLYGFDLDNCLDRMTTSGIVNLIVSGKADYVFSTETLSADTKVKLTVDDFDVDNREIMKLPRKVYVDGNVTIGADGVKLHHAIVKTKNETSRLIVKNSFYGFADSMKFHIPVVSGSWINLEDVGMITGFQLKGQGAIEALVTSYYENPLITGKFSGSDCFFDGFSAEECSINTILKEFVLKIGIDEIKQRTVRSKGSWVSLDFNRNDFPVAFKIANVSGDIRDGAAVFDVDAKDVSGKFFLDAEGVYTDGISRLNAKLRTGKVSYGGNSVADSIAINFADEKDRLSLKDTVIKKGESSIVLKGGINKKDLLTDISAEFNNLTPMDLTGSKDLEFSNPFLHVQITGALNEPDIVSNLKLKDIIYSDIKMGDFSVFSKYEGKAMDLSLKGKLGKNIKFSTKIPGMNFDELKGLIDIDSFVYKVGDVFVKTSARAKIEGENIDSTFTTLMFEKAGFFLRNIKPFTIRGNYDSLVIDKTYFDGETANFAIEGELRKLVPYIKLKGTAFPRMIDMIYPNLIEGVDGKFYVDLMIEDENINGEIRLANGSYKLTSPQILFNDVNATVTFNNRKWKIDNFRGFAGGGKAVLQGEGTMFPFDNASLKLKLVNLTGKHNLIGDFSLSSDLDIIMFDPEQISVSGNLELKNVVYNRPLSLDSEFIKLLSDLGKTDADSEIKESTPVDLDIKITGRNNIRIKTNLIESDIYIDTTLSGTTEDPRMSGTISLKNARIEYKQNDFTVQRGILTFEENRGISPFLDIESFRNITTKVQEDEKDYKIIMYATGYVLEDDLKLTFDSIPQLDQQQLISLLLWGNTGDNITGDLAIAAVTDIMGITTAVRKNFRLSRFELIPKYSELDDKTILKLVAEKEIYDNLFLLFESNPADTTDQIIQMKYKNKRLEAVLEWRNKDRLENSFGGIGFDLKLEYVFE